MKRLGKIKVHHVVGLHNDIVYGKEIQRIIDIFHQIQHKDLDVPDASDR